MNRLGTGFLLRLAWHFRGQKCGFTPTGTDRHREVGDRWARGWAFPRGTSVAGLPVGYGDSGSRYSPPASRMRSINWG